MLVILEFVHFELRFNDSSDVHSCEFENGALQSFKTWPGAGAL